MCKTTRNWNTYFKQGNFVFACEECYGKKLKTPWLLDTEFDLYIKIERYAPEYYMWFF